MTRSLRAPRFPRIESSAPSCGDALRVAIGASSACNERAVSAQALRVERAAFACSNVQLRARDTLRDTLRNVFAVLGRGVPGESEYS